MVKHGFPPNWSPQTLHLYGAVNMSPETRERDLQAGKQYAKGTIAMPGTPKDRRAPEWMK
jgi:hypothetical protein